VSCSKRRNGHLTTAEMHDLDRACELIDKGFGDIPYLVGSAMERGDFRDVDIRLILDDEKFDALFADRSPHLWDLLSIALGDYLRVRTGLPIDFQIQRMTEANEKHHGSRNPLGIGVRRFAGGGDATPNYIREERVG